MFNLNETFEKAWSLHLEEQAYRDCENLIESIDAERQAAEKSFAIVSDYLNICEMTAVLESQGAPVGSDRDIMASMGDLLKKVSNASDHDVVTDKDKAYTPIAGISLTQDFFSFKFPQNIIFLIGRIVDWIKRVVINFIAKFKNIINIIFGYKVKELTDDEKDLELRFTKTKEFEKTVGVEALPKNGKNKFISVWQAAPGDIKQFAGILSEADDSETAKLDKDTSKRQIVISVDISKELMSLEQLLSHYFVLFDNALGSNGEYLFGTDDLEIMLKMFKDAIDDVKNYRTDSYEIAGAAVEVSPIDDKLMKDNLQRTHVNTENLKQAYQTTVEAVKRVSTILTQKQLVLASNMGVQFAFYSSATYARMIRLLDIIKPRLKDATKMYKSLEKMETMYGKVAQELSSYSRKIGAVASVSYISVYQRKVANLFNSARYMTQIIGLRMTSLATYINSLREVQEIIISINKSPTNFIFFTMKYPITTFSVIVI